MHDQSRAFSRVLYSGSNIPVIVKVVVETERRSKGRLKGSHSTWFIGG